MDAVLNSDHQNMTSDLDPLLGSDSFIEPNTDSIDLTEPQPESEPEPQPEPETPIQPPPSVSSNGGSNSQLALRGRRVRSGAELSADEQWLPASWSVEDRVRTSGASAGHVDKYYVDPVSGKRFRSKKEVLQYLETGVLTKKKKTSDNLDSNTKLSESSTIPNKKAKGAAKFDFLKVPERVEWVLTDANNDTWTPFLGPKKVSEHEKRQWTAAFTSVTTKGYGNRL